jgi:hypothetical protein
MRSSGPTAFIAKIYQNRIIKVKYEALCDDQERKAYVSTRDRDHHLTGPLMFTTSMKRCCLWVLLCLLAARVLGNSISGQVLDAETYLPLPFASISVMDSQLGTISNSEGYFVLSSQSILGTDTLLFSYMGYETFKRAVQDFEKSPLVYLRSVEINLDAVTVYSRQLTGREIIGQVRENYSKNHPERSEMRRMFYHKFERTPFPEENQIHVKHSDFVGMDKATIEGLLKMLPDEFTEYQDAVLSFYNYEDKHKLVPVEAISLEEDAMQDLEAIFEKKLGAFFEDIEKSKGNQEIYYKFRTGVFAMKADTNPDEDTGALEPHADSLHYRVSTTQLDGEVSFLLKDYGSLKSDNWEFITKPNRYDYRMEEVTVFNGELVYQVAFTPRERGLFEGTLYVSTESFAILQLDFAYAPGKTSENIHLLGFGHSMNSKQGRVIFEKGKEGYFVKYIQAKQHETASIARDFTIMKKQKRFLIDKELNEIKLEAALTFEIHSDWELLILDRNPLEANEFETVKQPAVVRFRKEYSNAPDLWDNRTVIAPSAELTKYTRKE